MWTEEAVSGNNIARCLGPVYVLTRHLRHYHHPYQWRIARETIDRKRSMHLES